MKFKKIRIPILGIISIILSYYFVILQPKITYSIGKSKFNYSTARGYSNNDIAFLCELSIKLKNKGIKPSYLKKIEIHPVDVYLDSFSIQKSNIEEKVLNWRDSENIKIDFTYLSKVSSMAYRDSVYNTNKYRITFFDEDNNAILDSLGKVGYLDFWLGISADRKKFKSDENLFSFQLD